MLAALRRYLITGLLIWIPMVTTLWLLHIVISSLDQLLQKLFPAWQPFTWLGMHVPGVGVAFTLIVLLLTGIFVSNIVGRQLFGLGEGLLQRIPVVKSIYSSVKQVSDTVLASNSQAFRKVLLVPYPHARSWAIAFQTGASSAEVAQHASEPLVSVYVPTTPNPTSGFFLMVPQQDVVELHMPVDAALKYIISMGTVPPQLEEKIVMQGDPPH